MPCFIVMSPSISAATNQTYGKVWLPRSQQRAQRSRHLRRAHAQSTRIGAACTSERRSSLGLGSPTETVASIAFNVRPRQCGLWTNTVSNRVLISSTGVTDFHRDRGFCLLSCVLLICLLLSIQPILITPVSCVLYCCSAQPPIPVLSAILLQCAAPILAFYAILPRSSR